jgi:hypothetical protein
MSSEQLHAPRERLSKETLAMHHAIVSLIEELEAVDWYRQRADDCEDHGLKAILLHNMREEMEHAAMVLEWLRRNNEDFAGQLKDYLYSEGDIAAVEEDKTAKG